MAVSATFMGKAIKDLQGVVAEIEQCRDLYQQRTAEVRRLKKENTHLISQNANLKSTVEAFLQFEKNQSKQQDKNDDLLVLSLTGYSEKLKNEQEEKDLAFVLLKFMDDKMDQAIKNALRETEYTNNVTTILTGIRDQFQQARTTVAQSILGEMWSAEAKETAQVLIQRGLPLAVNTADDSEDVDSKMDK